MLLNFYIKKILQSVILPALCTKLNYLNDQSWQCKKVIEWLLRKQFWFSLCNTVLWFRIQLLVLEILYKTNVRGWVIFEKANNFGASLLFKLFKSGLKFWIWDIAFYLFKASKSDLSIPQSSPSNLFWKHVENSISC